MPRSTAAALALAAALAGAAPAHATFVHSVGRDYMIREWVDEDLDADLLEITPIMHGGNPAYRVVYRPRSDGAGLVRVLVRADDFRDMKPVLVEDPPR